MLEAAVEIHPKTLRTEAHKITIQMVLGSTPTVVTLLKMKIIFDYMLLQ